MRCDPVQRGALGGGLFDNRHVTCDEVSQTAMNHFRTATRGAAGQILGFNQCHRQTPHGGISGYAGAGNPTTDHQQIEALIRQCP